MTQHMNQLLPDGSDPDEAALAHLSRQLLPTLTRFASARGASDPEAVANQALFDGIRSIDTLRTRDDRTFRSYLFTCVANRVRSEHRRPELPTVSFDVHRHSGTESDPADLVSNDGWLDDVLGELLPDQQAVIAERFIEGSTIQETADRLGKSPHSVRHLQARGLARIRRYLLAAGVAALAVAAFFVSERFDQDQQIQVEPVEEPGPLLSEEDNSPPTTVGNAEDSTGSSVLEVGAQLDAWTECSPENNTCTVPVPSQVRYGAAGLYTYAEVAEAIECSNGAFGVDPAPNVPKTCSYASVAGNVVALESIGSGKCVDIDGTKVADQEQLIQWTCTPGVSQHQWRLDPQTDNSYLIRSALSDLCVTGASLDGGTITQQTCDADGLNQRWTFSEQGDGGYLIGNRAEDMCLGIDGDGSTDGGDLVQRDCLTTGNEQQRWHLINIGA